MTARILAAVMRLSVLLGSLVILLGCTVRPAFADLKVEFRDGFVTIDAKNVTVRQILAEWARLGGTRVVNGDRISGAPVTLQLLHVPERQALDVLLRSVSGYLAARRAVASNANASMFDRILVMPTSASPVAAQRPATPAAPGYQGAPRGPMPGQIPRAGMQGPPPQIAGEPDEDDEPDQGDIVPAPVPPTVSGGGAQPGADAQPQTADRPGSLPGSPNTVPQVPASGSTQPPGATTPGVIVQPPANPTSPPNEP